MRHSGFIRHIATLIVGNAGAMAISILAAPIISRLFTPSDFGIAALFVTLVLLGGSIAPLNYERAINLPKKTSELLKLVSLSFRALSFLSGVILCAMTVLWSLDLPIPFEEQLGGWVWMLPAGVWIAGMEEIVLATLTRAKKYKSIAYNMFSKGLVTTGGRITAGAVWGSSVSGLIIGFLLGFTVYLVLAGKHVRQIRDYLSTRHSAKDLRETAINYRDFPIYSMPATFATRFSSRLPILVMGAIFAPEILGFYAMADRLVRSPLLAAGQAIRRVYTQRTAAIVSHGGDLRMPYLKTAIGLATTGLIPLIVLELFGTDLIRIILGERWTDAGVYVEILAPWYYAVWIGTISQSTMIVLRRQLLWFWLQIAVLAVRVAVFASAYLLASGPVQMLTAFTTANVIMAIIIFIISTGLVWKHRP